MQIVYTYLETVEFPVCYTIVFDVGIQYQGESHPVPVPTYTELFVFTVRKWE